MPENSTNYKKVSQGEVVSPDYCVPASIFSMIRDEKETFINDFIYPVPGLSFSQYNTLKRIHLYSNDTFENGQYYGNKQKIFFNIVNNPTELAATMLDFDTKHIKSYSIGNDKQDKLFLFDKEAQYYFKKKKFSGILNDLATEVARYGSAVIKKTQSGVNLVDLRKLFLDPSVDRISKSRFIIIEHEYTPSELRDIARKNGWNKDVVANVIKKFRKTTATSSYADETGTLNQVHSTPYIKVHERWGEVPAIWFDKKADPSDYVKAVYFVAGAENELKNEQGQSTGEDGEILFKSRWYKAFPFKDFHYTKTKGRWLGVGIVEKLFPIQIRFNELKNQQRFAMELSSKHLFQSRGGSVFNNLLTDVDNGQVLITKQPIEPVVNEERNMVAFSKEEESYYKAMQDITFSYEAIRGDMGTSTTATTASISTQRNGSVFDFKKENIGNDMRDFLNDFIKDDIISGITMEHVLIFTGNIEELNIFDEKFAQAKATKHFVNLIKSGAFRNKNVDLPTELNKFKEKVLLDLKRGVIDRSILIEQDYFADSDIWLDFNLTNESIDPNAMFSGSNTVLIALAQNPSILQDPRLKVIFYKYMESLGINPTEIELAEKSMQFGQGGSSLPAVSPEQNPQMLNPVQAKPVKPVIK